MIMTQIFKIEKINQIGVVVRDVKERAKLLETFFGLGPFQILERPPEEITFRGKQEEFQIKNGLAWVGPLQIELIEVVKGNCCQAEFLKQKGEGLHHFGIYVDDLDAVLALAKDNGIELLQRGAALGAIQWAYLDTEAKFGIVIELMQIGKSKKKKSD